MIKSVIVYVIKRSFQPFPTHNSQRRMPCAEYPACIRIEMDADLRPPPVLLWLPLAVIVVAGFCVYCGSFLLYWFNGSNCGVPGADQAPPQPANPKLPLLLSPRHATVAILVGVMCPLMMMTPCAGDAIPDTFGPNSTANLSWTRDSIVNFTTTVAPTQKTNDDDDGGGVSASEQAAIGVSAVLIAVGIVAWLTRVQPQAPRSHKLLPKFEGEGGDGVDIEMVPTKVPLLHSE